MAWLKSLIKGVMLDITGVLKNGDVAIDGSIEAVKRLRDAGLLVRFVTNETQFSRNRLTEKLINLGFQLRENEVFPPAPAMVELLKENDLNPLLLVHPRVLPDFRDVIQSNPNCVVVGDAVDYFTYERMNDAFKLLMTSKEPRLFTLGRGRYYMEEDGLCLDVGGFTAALEYATGLKAEVVGKPAKSFFATALNDMGLSSSEVLMIGDDIESDVGGAQMCGMRGVLVRTGKFRPERDEKHPTVKPDAIVDNLALGVDMILASEAVKPLSKQKNGTTNGERGPKRRRNRSWIKKADIGSPQDFIHVASVKSPTKIEVNFNDPVISHLLQRAEVTSAALSEPKTQKIVRDFIESVGLDAIRREFTSTACQQQSSLLNLEEQNEENGAMNKRDMASSQTQSCESTSVIFSSEHDIEITSEIDDVFEGQKASPTIIMTGSHQGSSKNSTTDEVKGVSITGEEKTLVQLGSENSQICSPDSGETDCVEEPLSPKNEKKKKESTSDHDKFLHELKNAIKKREARMKQNEQTEKECGEKGWSGWRSPTKSKCQVSFFDPESPSPKPARIVPTLWDLTSESNYVTETDVNDVDTQDSTECTVSNTVKETKNAINKPKLPLTKGTEAINKIASTEELASPNDEDFKKSKNSIFTAVSKGDSSSNQSFNHVDTTQNVQFPSEISGKEPAPLMPNNKSKDLSETTNPEDNKTTEKVQDSTEDLLKKQKPSQTKNISSWFNRRNHVNKSSKKTLDSESTSDVNNPAVQVKRVQPDLEKTESSGKKGRNRRNQSVFNSLIKRKVKEELPSTSVTSGEPADCKEVQDLSKSAFSTTVLPSTSTDKQVKHVKVKKQDICVQKDMRHTTHITWDPVRHHFILHHTDDDELRKILLEEKLCEEAPIPKQRRRSYSMAIDVLDLEINCENDPRSSVQSSNSLAPNLTVFSRGAKKRVPIPRPRSEIPKPSNPLTEL